MRKKIGVGIIGLGNIFPRHLDAVKKTNGLELRAVCDTRKKIAQEIGRRENVNYYTDYHSLLQDETIDIVSVCTPNGLHFPIGMEIAKKGKHCIMEKPLALNYSDAHKLVTLFKKQRKWLFPVLQVRYNPAIMALKKYVDKNSLGKIFSASVVIRWSRPKEYFSSSPWKGSKKMDGGALLTQGIHYIDVMQYILGPAKSVFGKVKKVIHTIETEDTVNALIDFKSGAGGTIEFTICAYPHNLECSLAVLGEKGTIKIGGPAMNVCEFWEVKDVPRPKIAKGLKPNIYESGGYVGSCPNHKYVYQNAVNAIFNNKSSSLSANDALESIKIIDGIKRSDITGKEIIFHF